MADKALTNVTVSYDGFALEDYLNSASIAATVNTIDTTVLSDTAATSIPGSVDWTVPVGGPWDKAVDDVLGDDAVNPPDDTARKTLIVVLGPVGSTVTYTWTTAAYVGDYTIDATDPAGLISWSGTLAVSGAPTRV